MNNRSKRAFQALFDVVKDDKSKLALYTELQDAVESEVMALAGLKSSRIERVSSFSDSVAGRAILERAWEADPKRTETDLILAGRQDLASVLGAWWAGESHRRGPVPEATNQELDAAVVDEYRQLFIEELMEERRFLDLIARAYRADPTRTEYDLVALGMRDMATDLGAVQAAEAHRQAPSVAGGI